ncbi:MAG: hypothetical protein IT444_11760 [Phycisphaeraceae bacterium]|nr:hypothetical protein [Phycisphaeraceae bacterium]
MAKFLGTIFGFIRALPILIAYMLCKPILGQMRAFSAASERIGRLPGFLGVYARQCFYKTLLSSVGVNVYFGFMSVFSKAQATVGDRVYIGRFCSIGWAEIGDDVMLADGVQILSGRHQHGQTAAAGTVMRDNPQEFTKVTIGAGAWIGAGAIVMADVGPRAIVGAGAVVIKPVDANAKVGGVPAKPLGM